MKKLSINVLLGLLLAPFFGASALTMILGVIALSFVPKATNVFFGGIPLQDITPLFTNKLVAVYKEKTAVMSFLRSFFTPAVSMTKEVSIAVQRGTERVAVDVSRFSNGNRNTFDTSSVKAFIPPFYHEYMTANEHRLYDVVITSLSQGNTTYFAELTAELAEQLMELRNKIERAIEFQCSQVLETGIVTLNAGTSINFKRKSGSLVDKGAGNYWATGTVNPYKDIEAGCNFLRQQGKAQGSVFNLIMGASAFSDFKNNTIVKEINDLTNVSFDALSAPIRNSVGASLHGQISAGSYIVRVWTYNEVFEDASGNFVPYVNEKKVILLPEMPNFKLVYAAVPQLIQGGKIPQQGEYLIQDFIDEKQTSHEVHIKSAPIALPVAIDQIYTLKVVA